MGGEMICLDSLVFIDYFKKKSKEPNGFHQLFSKKYKLCTSSSTNFKIYQGSTEAQAHFCDLLFDNLHVYSVDDEDANTVASIHKRMIKKNKQLAKPDLCVSSIALLHNLRVVTLHCMDFLKVVRLKLTTPEL
jgi:predicted nucleic acid-binding protein